MTQITTHILMTMQKFVILFVVIALASRCISPPETQTEKETEYLKELAAKLSKTRNEDSLQIFLQKFIDEQNDFGEMLCYKHIGLRQREIAIRKVWI